MQKKILKKFRTVLIWFCVWSLSSVALLGVNLSHAQAAGDIIPPTISSITSIHADGIFKAEEIIRIVVNFSENVTSTGDITLILETGELDRTCTFVITDTNTASCDYVVQDGDNSSDLNVKSVSVSTTNAIKDLAGNEMTDFIPAINLADNKDIAIDTKVPEVIITKDPNRDSYNSGYQITAGFGDALINEYKLDSGGWTLYTAAVTVSTEGTHIFYTRGMDTAGNIGMAETIFTIDLTAPVMSKVMATLTMENQVQLSWNAVSDVDHYDVYRGGTLIDTITVNGYLDKTVIVGQNYVYRVVAVDAAGNESQPETANIFVPTPTPAPVITSTSETTPSVIQPAINSGVSTYKPSIITPEVKAAETPEVTNNNGEETSESSNWNKLLLAISILIIAAGAAVGGYYGYQWWMIKKDDDEKPKEDKTNSKSRW